MANESTFMRKQYEFAAHIRDPHTHPRPADIEARRMKIYTELFYNNVEGFISNSYPVLRAILDDDSWHRLIRDYFHIHRARTPLFPEMPREFLHYLQQERILPANDFPFFVELAHYEWAELALSLSDQEPDWSRIDTDGDLLEGLPVLSPLAWPLSYTWPVHKIGPAFLPDTPPDTPTYLLLYRDLQDEVHFMELNPVTARLLQLVLEGALPNTRAILQHITDELKHPDPGAVTQGGFAIIQDLVQRHVILGVYKD